MELTIREEKILNFIKAFGYCKECHIKAFVDATMAATKRIDHLVWQKEVFRYDDVISSKEEGKIDFLEMNSMIKVLNVAAILKEKEKIAEIEVMDVPYYLAAKTVKGSYIFMTIIEKGKETIQLKLIDNENKGGTVLILEDKTQIEYLKLLITKVAKVLIYEDIIKDN